MQVSVQNANLKFGNSVVVKRWIPREETSAAKNKELTLVEFGKGRTSQAGDKELNMQLTEINFPNSAIDKLLQHNTGPCLENMHDGNFDFSQSREDRPTSVGLLHSLIDNKGEPNLDASDSTNSSLNNGVQSPVFYLNAHILSMIFSHQNSVSGTVPIQCSR